MPIIRFTSDYSKVPEGAVNVRFQGPGFNLARTAEEMDDFDKRHPLKAYGPYVIITYDTYVGLCLKDREANGYDDSDFYMLVWDEAAGVAKEICFASTRGWSYPSYGSSVDATPEVRAKFEAWSAARQRRYRIEGKLKARAEKIELARAIGEPNYTNLKKLDSGLPVQPALKANAIALLKSKRLRSKFKLSLQAQILAWYFDPAPRFASPLSKKQWQYV